MTQTISHSEPWFVHLRAEASANLLLVKIPGIRIEQNKHSGPDMLICLPDSNGNETSRLMMVEVKATAFPIFQRDGLPKLPKNVQETVIKLSSDAAVPFCLFYFTTDAKKGEQAWAKWIAQPRGNGTLAVGDQTDAFFPLDESVAANLVSLASLWYENRRPTPKI